MPLVSGIVMFVFFFSSRRRHTRSKRDWSSDVCSSDLVAGREDLLGQIARCIALGGYERRRRDGRCGDRIATFVTEATARQVGVPARRTDRLQAPAAAGAELGACGVILPALGAAHVGPPCSRGAPARPRRKPRRFLRAFCHFDDVVRHDAVGFAVHGRRRFLAGGLDETEHLSGALVVPVPDVVHAVLALHGQIFLVGLGSHLGGEAIDLVVDIQVERHGPTLLSYGAARHREQLRASKHSWAPVGGGFREGMRTAGICQRPEALGSRVQRHFFSTRLEHMHSNGSRAVAGGGSLPVFGRERSCPTSFARSSRRSGWARSPSRTGSTPLATPRPWPRAAGRRRGSRATTRRRRRAGAPSRSSAGPRACIPRRRRRPGSRSPTTTTRSFPPTVRSPTPCTATTASSSPS